MSASAISLAASPAAPSEADGYATMTLDTVIRQRLLLPHFQPVIDLVQGAIYGHESLIRGPEHTLLYSPDALFHEARRLNINAKLELISAQTGARHFCEQKSPGYLFLNMSASALMQHWDLHGEQFPLTLLGDSGLAPSRVIIELTEHDPVACRIQVLSEVFAAMRVHGMRLALDDYGVGHSSLQLWAETRPDLVKIDRYFFNGISRDEGKQKLVRAVLAAAQSLGTPLLAEGIETEDDLAVARDLGIRYAQGWYLGRPAAAVTPSLPAKVSACLASRALQTHSGRGQGGTAASLRVEAPSVLVGSHTNDEVHRLFLEHKELHAVAVVDDEDRPVGIINRRDFSERYAQRYTRELFGRDLCSRFMNPDPVLVDLHASIDQLSRVLISDDQRYLIDGFIITRDGRYDGLGTGEALVRSVTEMRIEAARYANPLTSLPGNIPISQHIGGLLEQGADFVTCYGDLNNFKPFNDVYGYWRGDDMILLCADILKHHCDPQRDFVGHVGGDDFVVLLRSPDWLERVRRAIDEFNTRAMSLYDEQGRARGGIEAEDRYGVPRFFPFVTLSVGALMVNPALCGRIRPEDIASAAAQVKHKVKHGSLSLVTERYNDIVGS
ncbi:EAL domain-containing protein [Orrella dioscoreae]|uniref:Diguanylate cyclase/phosphodiesterase domain 2 (EAL) n=1 Tax=Orrella dioscoreae TaxID=1851544 RepID=A0A1C3JX12_9BURK|nr:Diguanylate cyclase/phosphodiesterase domain 2 (EAL) [Orrella dioscoreae]SOE49733.1 Diguanylate cyclase/phosphodiesterase domain 2 (EAL) [Orrella dioscoreae]